MLTPSAALSISDQVEKFGAYAGFAAVVGLAVLALLYFASARELKRLREWADRAPERVADLEARVGEMARQRVVTPQPVGKAAAKPGAKPGAQPATAAATAASKPAAKTAAAAGNGAAEGDDRPGDTDEDEAAASEQEGDKPAVFDVAEDARGDLTEIKKPAKGDKPVSDETLVSPGAGRALRQSKPSARPRKPPPVRPSTARLMESARASNAQRVAGAPPGGSGSAMPPGEGPGRKKFAIIGAAVAGVIVVLILAVTVLGGGDEPAPKSNTVPPATTTTPADETTVNRAATEVAVLNGTTFAGLAKSVADEITAGGFKRGEVRNALDNTRAATLVEYSEGNRPAALEVAKTIDVGADAVQAVQEGSRVRAPNAQVIVTVGADQTPQTTG